MKCPVCEKEGKKSVVYQGHASSTLLMCRPFYDEDGKYHNHDRNTSKRDYDCSNGHEFTVETTGGCIQPDCKFKEKKVITVTKPADYDKASNTVESKMEDISRADS